MACHRFSHLEWKIPKQECWKLWFAPCQKVWGQSQNQLTNKWKQTLPFLYIFAALQPFFFFATSFKINALPRKQICWVRPHGQTWLTKVLLIKSSDWLCFYFVLTGEEKANVPISKQSTGLGEAICTFKRFRTINSAIPLVMLAKPEVCWSANFLRVSNCLHLQYPPNITLSFLKKVYGSYVGPYVLENKDDTQDWQFKIVFIL